MNSIFKFYNPYNFVRPIRKRDSSSIDKDSILMDRCPPPPHDRYISYTGRIQCRLEVKTPLLIGMYKDSDMPNNSARRIEFFKMKRSDGKLTPTIPSSSLRGVIRSVFEAATNSCFAIFDDSRLFKRMKPEKSLEFIPARLERNGNSWIARLFRGPRTKTDDDHLQYAAWIKAYKDEATHQRADRYQKRPKIRELKDFKHGEKCYAIIENKEYSRGRFCFHNVISLHNTQPEKVDNDQYCVEGYVYNKGKNIRRKHDERFFFPADSKEICEISEGVIADYKKLLDERENKEKLFNGSLVWVKPSENEKEVDAIIPVAISKIRYHKSRGDLLAQYDLLNCTDISKLCPACRVFGWVPVTDQQTDLRDSGFKGRVGFNHAFLKDQKHLKKEELILTLASPKPTAKSFYLLDDETPSGQVDYDSHSASIRGRKFFLHHKRFTFPQGKSKPNEKTDTIITEFVGYKADFDFVVEFENLAAVELGALVWALTLEEGMYHRLGMAKAYGFGSVRISIKEDGLILYDMRSRYTSSKKVLNQPADSRSFIQSFKKAMKKLYGEFDELGNIKDLKSILSGPDDDIPIHYPRCKREYSDDNKGYEWFMAAKKHKGVLSKAVPLKPLDSKPCREEQNKKSQNKTKRGARTRGHKSKDKQKGGTRKKKGRHSWQTRR